MINDVDCCEVWAGWVADKDQSATFGERETARGVACPCLVALADLGVATDVEEGDRGVLAGSGERVPIRKVLQHITNNTKLWQLLFSQEIHDS